MSSKRPSVTIWCHTTLLSSCCGVDQPYIYRCVEEHTDATLAEDSEWSREHLSVLRCQKTRDPCRQNTRTRCTRISLALYLEGVHEGVHVPGHELGLLVRALGVLVQSAGLRQPEQHQRQQTENRHSRERYHHRQRPLSGSTESCGSDPTF